MKRSGDSSHTPDTVNINIDLKCKDRGRLSKYLSRPYAL